jgi:hypothetical protein
MKIQILVEGQGDVSAVPILLRRLQVETSAYEVTFGTPIRRPASVLYNQIEFQRSLQLARNRDDCDAILILFDLEDGCPKEKAEELNEWARETCGSVPFAVVLAYREYETWFLAALESLRGCCGIDEGAEWPDDPESRRDAKSALEAWMPRNRSYSETLDQPTLTQAFDMAAAYRRNRSFRRLINAFGQLLHALGASLEQWPPLAWQEEANG